MRPTDKDMFGNVGTLYPNDKFRLFVSTNKDIEFGDIGWLKGLEGSFTGYKIK